MNLNYLIQNRNNGLASTTKGGEHKPILQSCRRLESFFFLFLNVRTLESLLPKEIPKKRGRQNGTNDKTGPFLIH